MGAEVKVVPLEPTPEMYGAGGVQQFKCYLASVPVRDAVGMVYRAMLAAAPAPTDEDPTTPEAQVAYWKGAFERMAARNVELAQYAKAATVAITGLTVGGSEFFGKQIDGFYTADLAYCVDHVRGRFAKGHEAWLGRAKAEQNLRHWREECGKLHARLSLRDTFIAEKGLWSEFAETSLASPTIREGEAL